MGKTDRHKTAGSGKRFGRGRARTRAYTIWAWACSLLLHGLLLAGAAWLLGAVEPISPKQAFRWDVALVEHAPAQPAREPAPREARPRPEIVETPRPRIVRQSPRVVERAVTVRQEDRRIITRTMTADAHPSPRTVRRVSPPAPAAVASARIVRAPGPVETGASSLRTRERRGPVRTVEPQPVVPERTVASVRGRPDPGRGGASSRPPARVIEPEAPVQAARSLPVLQPTPSSRAVQARAPTETASRQTELATVKPVRRQTRSRPVIRPVERHAERHAEMDAPVRVSRSGPRHRADFGWLAQTLHRRVAAMKRYPSAARMKHLEGRVVLRAVIGEDGSLSDLSVEQSSGHGILDREAMDLVRRVCPVPLEHPLGRSKVIMHIPIAYDLR